MRLFILLAALFASGAPAMTPKDPSADRVAAAPTGPVDLFVELVINGQAGGALAAMTLDGNRLLIEADALRSAGIDARGSGMVDIAHMADVRATYDAAGQRLLLQVAPALLPLRRIAAAPVAMLAPSIDAGALFNYDLYVQSANRRTSASLWTEQRAFGRFGTLSNTGVVRTGDRRRTGYLRFDTQYRWTDEARALEVSAGDLITRALPWSTSVRMGGIQLSRSFALRPDLVTVPLPSFAGEASVPTGVDLFINGYRQSQARTAPGRFVLDSVPVVNGSGEARIVTIDAVGRQIATVIPFYVAPELLRPGLTDFSVEAGALRTGYGRTSFGYGRAAASASIRRGMTARLTLSGHAEAMRGMAGAGIGAGWSPGLWGVVSGSVAVSRARLPNDGKTVEATGGQFTASYSYVGRRITLGAEHVERSGDFTDLGGFDLGRLAGSRRSDRISISMPIHGIGGAGAGFIAARSRDGVRTQLGSASLSVAVGRRASAFVAADYDFRQRKVSAQLRLIMPLGGNRIVSAGVSREPSRAARVQASIAQPAPLHGGIGYGVDVAHGDGRTIGQASATWRADTVQIDAGVTASGGDRFAWASVAGSVAMLEGRAFLANSLPGAFALVSTGAARVPVFYENQLMGTTDAGGRLFVANVAARHAGRFAIDPVDLPIGAMAERTETRVALRGGTGAIIRLPVAFRRSVIVRIVDAAGRPLAPGTVATATGAAAVSVGWDGVMVINDAGGRVEIVSSDGAGPCRAVVEVGDGSVPFTDLGVVTCR